MSSNMPASPSPPGASRKAPAPSGLAGAPGVRRLATSHWVRAARLLQTSGVRISEIYAAFDHPAGGLSERLEAAAQLYRSHLAKTVVRALPLVLDSVSPEEVAQALREITQPVFWERRPPKVLGWSWGWRSPERILNGAKFYGASPFGNVTAVDAAFGRPFRAEGHVIRRPSHALGGLGVRPVGDCLEIMLLIRGTLIMSWRGSIRITTPSPLPETVAIAARGRLLSELIDSPLFNGRDYRIRNVTVKGGVSIITATARAESYQMPELVD